MPEAINDRTDEVLELHRADDGVRVDLVERQGYDETIDLLKVYGTRSNRYNSIEDGEPTEVERKVQINEMTENVGFEVLQGLAEYYGYRVEPK